METIKRYFELNGVTGYQIAKKNDVTQPTIDRAANQPLYNLSFKNMRTIANTIGKSVGQVVDELNEWDKK